MMKLDFRKLLAVVAATALSISLLAGCGSSTQPANADSESNDNAAEIVVYGKIYTSKTTGDYAEAFAVKDGKYIYVGDEAGAEQYIKDGVTEVIDRRDKGLVMSGATEGHGHYIMASELQVMDAIVGGSTAEEILVNMKAHVEKYPDKEAYFVMGWETSGAMKESRYTYNMRAKLDEICPDKIIFMMNNVGHGAFLNSKAIEMAGYNKDTVLEGGIFARDENGELLGFVEDVAVNYALEKIVTENELISVEDVRKAVKNAADSLHACGFTNYFDAATNMFGANTYEGIKEEDEDEGLTFNAIAAYKIDPYADIDKSVATAADYMHKYGTTHFKADNIKLFADGGAVEVKTGWMLEPYADGTYGNRVWSEDRMYEIVKKANEQGISVHTHASGDAATKQSVEAYVNAEPTAAEGVLNGIGHSRHITDEIKDVMAEHNIYSATNVNWRYTLTTDTRELIETTTIDFDIFNDGYPMKSLLDRGIVMTSATDYPATDGAPYDMCSIIEIGVNGTIEGLDCGRMQEDEFLTVEEMLDVFTINGAKQFGFADERGSVEEGKYADFIFLDKDITTCELDEIHEAKVDNVYFEGQKVYSAQLSF